MPPTFHIEDHAVDRYIERVRDCPRTAARKHLQDEATRGGLLREKTAAGNPMLAIEDCVLVLGDHYACTYAVVTVLGPGELGDDLGDTDEERLRNALADASRRGLAKGPASQEPAERAGPLDCSTLPMYVDPVTVEEAAERRRILLAAKARLEAHLGQRPRPVDHKTIVVEVNRTNEHLRRLREWVAAENVDRDRQARISRVEANRMEFLSRQSTENRVVRDMTARIERLRADHHAALERGEEEKKRLRLALRIAVRSLVEMGAADALARIAEIEPWMVRPEFYLKEDKIRTTNFGLYEDPLSDLLAKLAHGREDDRG